MQILLYVVRGIFFFFPLRGWEQDNFVGKIFEDFSLLFFFHIYIFLFYFRDTRRQYFIFPTTHSLRSFSYFPRNHSEIACSTRARTHLCKLRISEGKNPLAWQTQVFSVTCADLVKVFEMGEGSFREFLSPPFLVFAPPSHYFNRRRNKLAIFISLHSSVLFCR